MNKASNYLPGETSIRRREGKIIFQDGFFFKKKKSTMAAIVRLKDALDTSYMIFLILEQVPVYK